VDRAVQSVLMEAVIERERLDADASDGEAHVDLSGLEILQSPAPDDHIDTVFWKLMMRVAGQRMVREIVADFGFDLEEFSLRLRPFVESGLLRFRRHDHGAAGAFLNALERRMFELFGSIGLVMIESTAKSASIHLEAFRLDQAALFLTVLELEIPLERRRAFSWVARGLLERFNQLPLVPDEQQKGKDQFLRPFFMSHTVLMRYRKHRARGGFCAGQHQNDGQFTRRHQLFSSGTLQRLFGAV
jgi:hypothetical protein